MRHPHGLRAAAGGGIVLPAIGASFEGGFFAGAISHTANGVPTHLLIVAPKATGASGSGYTITTDLAWKTSNTTTPGTDSDFDGSANSANMNNASHPAAQFCETLSIGGYTDWYMPARYELEIAYYNLKPTTTSNDTLYGTNAYSVPARGSNYTAGTPAQTTVTAFQTGNSEAFVAGTHWSSTEYYSSSSFAWGWDFTDGNMGGFNKSEYLTGRRVRAFRKLAL